MSLSIDHIQEWGDGIYRFALPIRQLDELDDKTSAGPLTLVTRLMEGGWRIADVRETIRLGLIGGGSDPVAALKLVQRYVDGAPLEQSLPLAASILMASIRGRKVVAEDAPGNRTAATSVSDPTGSTSPPSDAMPSSSASDLMTSVE